MPDEKKEAFSLSFAASGSKHRHKRVKVNEDEEKPQQEYVTGLSETGLTLRDRAQAEANGHHRVIPNLGNDLRGTGPRAYNPNRQEAVALSALVDQSNLCNSVRSAHQAV